MEQWPVLERFWARVLDPGFDAALANWNEETGALNGMGIATESALQFLYGRKPDLDAYRQWLQEHRRDSRRSRFAPADVLSADELAFWDANGYLLLKRAVPAQLCADVRDAMWTLLGASADDSASWYRPHECRRGAMLNLFDHPALEAVRGSEYIYQACRQLYGSSAIHGTVDKTGFTPPEKDDFHFMGSPLHWDTSLALPIPFRLQGMLYLTDCAAHEGAFHCVPGFHHRIGAWLASLPPDADPRELAPRLLEAQAVAGEAGDFLIWRSELPHCGTPNHGRAPRMVQYLTYLPDAADERAEWR
ncbi:phytanoyl-CoA dioxygenase family protein [Massilia endophytica]|uniref:phytanoyl-CoA dioxygenase family protein n=1 Tax=Massilia endophytica TaxID=2899220 RepID=UPI001E2F2A1E|nr:phytanoyl-CoA dioxygenase family protein [Massilia endophytica]UGQ48558.1 phytanoyl-CoA dioxygenase family protein [Massilia endophytica]